MNFATATIGEGGRRCLHNATLLQYSSPAGTAAHSGGSVFQDNFKPLELRVAKIHGLVIAGVLVRIPEVL